MLQQFCKLKSKYAGLNNIIKTDLGYVAGNDFSLCYVAHEDFNETECNLKVVDSSTVSLRLDRIINREKFEEAISTIQISDCALLLQVLLLFKSQEKKISPILHIESKADNLIVSTFDKQNIITQVKNIEQNESQFYFATLQNAINIFKIFKAAKVKQCEIKLYTHNVTFTADKHTVITAYPVTPYNKF